MTQGQLKEMIHPEGHYEGYQGSELDRLQWESWWLISVEDIGTVSLGFC